MVALAAVILIVLVMNSRESYADRLAAVAAISGVAAVLLTVIAALVALFAYAVSTGSPDLHLRINFDFSYPNNPSFKAETLEHGQLRAVGFKQTVGRISLRNTSRYSAVNPAVIIRLQGMAFLPRDPLDDDWVQLAFASTLGVTAVQWDGGPKYSIHGESTRVLPALDFDKLYSVLTRGTPAFIFEILAEGYRKVVTIPVSFRPEDQAEPHQEGSPSLPEWI
jgi:hypothetical protein